VLVAEENCMIDKQHMADTAFEEREGPVDLSRLTQIEQLGSLVQGELHLERADVIVNEQALVERRPVDKSFYLLDGTLLVDFHEGGIFLDEVVSGNRQDLVGELKAVCTLTPELITHLVVGINRIGTFKIDSEGDLDVELS
jgi:hypothetical protein